MSYFKIVPIFLGDKYVSFHGFIKGVFFVAPMDFPQVKVQKPLELLAQDVGQVHSNPARRLCCNKC